MKYTFEFVKNYFEKEGCKLLEKIYVNANIPMKYICSCGNKSKIRFSAFKRGNRCKKCGMEKTKKKLRYTQEFVENFYLEQGCELIDVYVNNNTPMKYICSCGNEAVGKFKLFQSGHRCNACGIKKTRKKVTYTQEFVENYYIEHGAKSLETYVNSYTPMKYICSCGNESIIRFVEFKRGKRCQKCKGKRMGHIPYSEKDGWVVYRMKVRSYTTTTYNTNKNLINPLNFSSNTHDIDHIFTAKDGYVNNVPLYLMCNKKNLQMLTITENRSKGANSDISLNEFYKRMGV